MADVFLGALAYELGEQRPLQCLKLDGREDVLAVLLRDGLRDYCQSTEPRTMLGARTFAKTLAAWDQDPTEINLILYCSESMSFNDQAGTEFHRLCNERGLGKVPIVGLSLSSCANLVPALRFALAQIRSEGLNNVAIVAADKSSDANRIARMDVAILSDGASSCIISSREDGMSFRIRGFSQAADHLLRDLDYDVYRPRSLVMTAGGVRRAVRGALADAGVSESAVRHLLCSTLRMEAIRFFSKQCHIDIDNTFTGNLAGISHVHSSDFIINLVESAPWRAGRGLGAGDPFLSLLVGPYNWGAVVTEAVFD